MFTAKERDAETGLDYFGARYYRSGLGRFTSPDPFNVITDSENQEDFLAHLSNPQTWNKYGYGLNNPLKYVDPDGLDVELAVSFVGDVSDEEKARILAAIRGYLNKLNVGNVVVRDAGDGPADKRSLGQKLKDFFGAKEFHSLTIDFKNRNPFGNDSDKPNYVQAWNMATTGDKREMFGDLRGTDPQQWSNIVAWRTLHETIAHGYKIGSDFDQLSPISVGDPRSGTLIEGRYGRGRGSIPGLNPNDTRRLQEKVGPIRRTYGR